MSAEVTLTAENFKHEVLESEIPVLVDFWAEWCMPCKMIGPTVAQIAEAYKDRIKVGKLNVDDQSDIASQYGIISIPTLIVFTKGQVFRQKVGAVPRQEIEELFKDLI